MEVETDRAEKAAQAKHDGPEAVVTRLFGLLTADGKAEALDFIQALVPVHGDVIPPSIPELIRQGAPMSARRLTLADVVDCCLAMSPAHLNELADTAGALVRSEGKRPPLWEPADDQGDLLAVDGDVTILADLRQRVGEAIQRTELRWTTGWQAKAAEAMRTAYDSLLAVEDEAMNGKTAEDDGAEPVTGDAAIVAVGDLRRQVNDAQHALARLTPVPVANGTGSAPLAERRAWTIPDAKLGDAFDELLALEDFLLGQRAGPTA
ncbi:MAG TPA: hypothetical protein VM098_09845 [Phycisphaerae bacterium]|nr:hypothetical protein [Phycisphaerae bacterium]